MSDKSVEAIKNPAFGGNLFHFQIIFNSNGILFPNKLFDSNKSTNVNTTLKQRILLRKTVVSEPLIKIAFRES